jgi:hypothetical protein
MAGAWLSTTVTVWSQVELLPQLSVAVQVRVMTLSCAQLPAAELSAKLTAGSASQLSVALALPPVLAGLVFCREVTRVVMQLLSAVALISVVHCTVALAGQVITGATMSRVVISCWQSALLPQVSVAVQVRVIVLVSGQLLDVMLSAKLMTGALSQLSVAVALPVAAGALEASHSIVTLAGQVMAGALLSTTLMAWSQLSTLPQLSVAVQVRVISFSFAQLPAATLSLKLMSTSVSQLSVAVALLVVAGSVLLAAAMIAAAQAASALDMQSTV